MHLALAKSVSIKRYNRRTDSWRYPIECGAEILSLFSYTSDIDVDPALQKRINSHQYIIANKFKLDPPADIEAQIKTKMMDHQRRWLGFSKHFKAVANLCEQGTGKTKMALDWATMKDCRLILLIVKNSNVYKWAEEIKEHSDYNPYVLKGTRQDRLSTLTAALGLEDKVAVIINYDYVSPFLEHLKGVSWNAVILDESTAVKHPNSKRHKACVELGERTHYRLILTGTPLVNRPLDAYGQFRFLNPRIFGQNFQAFKSRYVDFGGFGGYAILGYRNLEELQRKISGYSFRVLKEECLDLPPKVYEPYRIEPPHEFTRRYDNLVDAELVKLGNSVLDNTLAITKLGRCMQLCDGFLYRTGHGGEFEEFRSPKIQELLDFMSDHFCSNPRLIIWAYFRASIQILEREICQEFPDLSLYALNGDTPVKTRSELINWFNDPHIRDSETRCVILQTAAFMHGINLSCDTAVYYSRSWSNEEWQQSQDRIHGIRRGVAGRSSTYITLYIPGTVEETVDKALTYKQELSAQILGDKEKLAELMRGKWAKSSSVLTTST